MYANVRPDENGNWGAIGVKNSTTGNELVVNADGSINVSGGGGGGGSGAIVSNASDAVATTSTNQAVASYGYGFNGTTWDRLQVDASKNLKVAIQGTPNVNATISGTPNVAVTSMPTTTVTGSVGITGTPNVNATITGTPSVSVTSMPTTTVTGSVGITGTPAVTATGSVANSSDTVATSATNLGTVGYNFGFNGTTWDRLQVDANKNLKVIATQGAVDSTALKQLTFQTAASALGAVTVDISGYNTVSLDVVITGTATVQFNVSNDGTNFTLIQYQTPQNTTASSTSVGNTTTRGLRFNVSGYKYFQSNVSQYTTGSITVSGFASTGTTSQSLYTLSATGGLIVTPRLAAGTDQAAMSQMVDGQTTVSGLTATGSMGFTGSAYDKIRIGKVYKWFEFILFAAGATQAVWTPTAGKKFRIMGVQISSGGAAFFYLQDATTTFYAVRMGGVDTKDFSFGNGYLSSAANNVLNVYNNTGSQVAVDVVVWGTEE